MTPPRILVVDDDADCRTVLDIVLPSDGYRVQTTASPHDGLQLLESFRPDLVIIDVELGADVDGFWLSRGVRSRSDIPVLFLSNSDVSTVRLHAFGVGADDYVAKSVGLPELRARIRALLKRSGRLSSIVHEVDDLVLDEEAHVVSRSGSPIELTALEFRLLRVLMSHVGQVVTKRALLDAVWGFDAYDPNLVEVHISALRRKLEANGPRLVHTVRSEGYVLRAALEPIGSNVS